MAHLSELGTDILVVGGGLGGFATALTAARLGQRVVLTEETDWLGGQLTSQAVPPDDHRWIETQCASPTYRRLRDGIRAYYRRTYPLSASVAADPFFNPGLGAVSRLCHEPKVALAVLQEMLAPHVSSGRVRIKLRTEPITAMADGDRVTAATFRDCEHGTEFTVSARYVVDATELGDVLELAGAEYTIGAEGRADTGELHAPELANPLDQQAITWCFALDHRPGESHVIARPASYEHWRDHVPSFWPGPQLSWTDVEPWSLTPRSTPLFAGNSDDPSHPDLWHFRRVFALSQLTPGAADSDITIANWQQNDYWEKPLLGVSADESAEALHASRELSLSLLYWMQTEAPRHDDGTGYPGLRLRGDVTGTEDGLAKAVYVREARRMRTQFTILEQHIGVTARGRAVGPELFHDSVGVGHYRIDLHPSTAGRSFIDIDCFPFQIPLGALIPVRIDNLLPANKNIGTTHITNGAYRLHPVEWSIGEAVGALVTYCLRSGVPPREVHRNDRHLADYQRLLSDTLGITLAWPDHISLSSTPREPHCQV